MEEEEEVNAEAAEELDEAEEASCNGSKKKAEDRFVRLKKKAATAAGGKKGAKYSKDYTEGWVEFRDGIHKRVAARLHNTPMGARKRSPFHYDPWNLKYLHRFTWSHLSEHLAFECQVRRQRLRAEVAQAK